jgi:hypothetical protein
MQLDNKLYQEIKEYCELNNLKTRDFIHNILKEAFLKEKYGESPFNKKNVDVTPNREEILDNFIRNITPQIDIENEINEIVSDNFFEFFDEKNTLNQNNDIQKEIHDNIQKEETVKIKKKRKLN